MMAARLTFIGNTLQLLDGEGGVPNATIYYGSVARDCLIGNEDDETLGAHRALTVIDEDGATYSVQRITKDGHDRWVPSEERAFDQKTYRKSRNVEDHRVVRAHMAKLEAHAAACLESHKMTYARLGHDVDALERMALPKLRFIPCSEPRPRASRRAQDENYCKTRDLNRAKRAADTQRHLDNVQRCEDARNLTAIVRCGLGAELEGTSLEIANLNRMWAQLEEAYAVTRDNNYLRCNRLPHSWAHGKDYDIPRYEWPDVFVVPEAKRPCLASD